MAGMFYTLIEVAERLGKTENQVRQMVQQGQLREFRDGPKLLFKKDEVDALSGQAGSVPDDTLGFEGDGIESEGSTMGLADDGVFDEELADKEQLNLEGDDIDLSLDASGLDMALGGDDLDLDMAASRAAQDLNLGDIDLAGDTDSAKSVAKENLAEEHEELKLLSDEDHGDLGIMSDDSGNKASLASDLGQGPIDEDELFSGKEAGQDDEIGFEDDFGIDVASENEGTKAATQGVSVLGQDDTAYSLTDDSLGETAEVRLEGDKELGEEHSLDEDVSLESFGSGSGLLDLSLQADDTSLGAVLDDIIPGVGGGGAGAEPGGFDGGMDLSEDALASGDDQAQVQSESASAGFGESTSNIGQVSVAAMAYIEPAPDASSNMFGAMLVIPFVVLVYTIIISAAGALGISPNLLGSTQDIIWYIGGGLLFVAVIMMFIGAAAGGSKGGSAKAATAKVAALKKVKPAKPVKAKKK